MQENRYLDGTGKSMDFRQIVKESLFYLAL
jgi:hypothetical protein